MNASHAIGWCACALMLMTFWCETPWCLRGFAVAANLAFVAYGWTADLPPVLALHLLLLPINLVRLIKATRTSPFVTRKQAGAAIPPTLQGGREYDGARVLGAGTVKLQGSAREAGPRAELPLGIARCHQAIAKSDSCLVAKGARHR